MTNWRSYILRVGICSSLIAGGCASSADKIAPQYVSSLQYQATTCDQLAAEAHRISSRVAQLSGVQDQKASSDAIATGVAIVVFWPAAFLVGGNDQTTAELARLKGELEAVERASVEKKCGLQIRQQSAPAGRQRSGA